MAQKYYHNGDIVAELWDEGLSVSEICERMKKGEKYVRQLMAQNGIEADPSPALNQFKQDWNRARWKLTGLPKDAKEQDYAIWFEEEWKKAVKAVLFPGRK